MRKLIVVLLVVIPSSVFAQSIDRGRDDSWRRRPAPYQTPGWSLFEITPFGGYRYGGTIYADRAFLYDFDTEVESSGNLGLNVGIPLGGTPLKLELMVNQQRTYLTSGAGLFDPGVRLDDFDITYYHAGLQVPFGNPRSSVVPFVILSGGVANLRPDIRGVEAENRFSASAGIGVKVPFNRNVGLRVEARGYYTSLGDDDCRGCYYYENFDNLYQGETNVGLVISF